MHAERYIRGKKIEKKTVSVKRIKLFSMENVLLVSLERVSISARRKNSQLEMTPEPGF